MVAMGYGGSQQDAARTTVTKAMAASMASSRKTGWGSTPSTCRQSATPTKPWGVRDPVLRGGAGSAQGPQGVFITTSSFSREAQEYVGLIEKRIVLIDGARLAALMIEYGVGVTTRQTLTIKTLDSDYFWKNKSWLNQP